MKTSLFLIALLIQSIGFADETFSIKPYVYTIKGQAWAVSWSYIGETPKDSQLVFKQNGHSMTIPASLERGLFTVVLPAPACEFGDVTYLVPGLKAPVKINDIPCPDTQGVTRFTFMADTQEGVDHDKVFATLINAFAGSAVLIAGDLVQTGESYKDWLSFFDALNPVFSSQILIPVVGNHEYRNKKDVPYWKHFFQTAATEDFYSVDVGPAHVMAINSCFADEPEMRVKQLGWLKDELEQDHPWKIIFFHHPPFSRSIANLRKAPRKEWLALQQDYVPLFEKYHVDLVLNGHTHIFEHSFKNGVQYLTMGPAGGIMGTYGARNKYSVEAHLKRTILEVELTAKELRAVTTQINGRVLNDLKLQK